MVYVVVNLKIVGLALQVTFVGRRTPKISYVTKKRHDEKMRFHKSTETGVDVTITFFCDFRPFSTKKLAFFSKTNVMINFFQNLALFRVKNAIFFAKFFGENILKIGPVENCIWRQKMKFVLQSTFSEM
jgi:hypothetical protein